MSQAELMKQEQEQWQKDHPVGQQKEEAPQELFLGGAPTSPKKVTVLNLGKQSTQRYDFKNGIHVLLTIVESDTAGWYYPHLANVSAVAAACGSKELACDGVIVGDNHKLGMDMLVAVCKNDVTTECPAEVEALTPLPPEDQGVALCVPTMRGDYLDKRFVAFLNNYMDYYDRHGVKQFFFYGSNTPPTFFYDGRVENVDMVTWIQFSFETTQLWYYGQAWELQDCIHRASAMGYHHVLSIDFDETLAFADPQMTLADYARDCRDRRVDVSTFGSAHDILETWCDDENGKYCHKRPPSLDAISCHGTACARKERENIRLCSGFCGHRKHLVYAPRILVANIHYVHHCKQEGRRKRCVTKTESTDDVWLRHFHGESLIEGKCPSCTESDRRRTLSVMRGNSSGFPRP